MLLPDGRAAEDLLQQREQALKSVNEWAASDFKLPSDLPLDPALRKALETLGAEHRTRITRLAETWADEEASHIEAPGRLTGLPLRVLARYFNETALWQLDTAGDDYDRLMLSAQQDPGLCSDLLHVHSPFGSLALALQRLTTGDREAVLAAQRKLLAHWGQHAVPPERPAVSLQDDALAAAQALRAVRRPEEPALPPLLAWRLLTAEKPVVERPDEACALVRWALQRPALHAKPVREQALLVRYAAVDGLAAERLLARIPGLSESGYPKAAAYFGVEGEVTVQGRRRDGRPGVEAPRIVARAITVPGIRGVRPVAFETLLDGASLDRAATAAIAGKPGRDDPQVKLKWVLQ